MTHYQLGRVVQHDPRSRNFPARGATEVKTVYHFHYGDALDQGSIGSCTGNAMAQALNTEPLANISTRRYYQPEAVDLYSLATQLDEFYGTYPPDDTGSSGVGVGKAAVKRGYINAYHHTFSLYDLLAALTLQPVLVGTNWYDGMFEPDENGVVTVSGEIAGGHEYILIGLNVEEKTVMALNSWGTGWGIDGMFSMSWDTLDRLLHEEGDCVVPIITAIEPEPLPEPIPVPEPIPEPVPEPVPTDPSADVVWGVLTTLLQQLSKLIQFIVDFLANLWKPKA